MRLLERIANREVRHLVAGVEVLRKTGVVDGGLVVVLEGLAEVLRGSAASEVQVDVDDETVVLLGVLFAAGGQV